MLGVTEGNSGMVVVKHKEFLRDIIRSAKQEAGDHDILNLSMSLLDQTDNRYKEKKIDHSYEKHDRVQFQNRKMTRLHDRTASSYSYSARTKHSDEYNIDTVVK